jgi:hypothetical protein
MLLRVAAVASAGALAAACSSGSSGGTGNPCGSGFICGSAAIAPTDAALDAPDDGPLAYCDTHVCGSVDASPPQDAGEDADARLPCGTGVCGSIVMLQDAAPETGDAARE